MELVGGASDVGKRPRGYKKHFPGRTQRQLSFLIGVKSLICIAENALAAQMKALVSLG